MEFPNGHNGVAQVLQLCVTTIILIVKLKEIDMLNNHIMSFDPFSCLFITQLELQTSMI